MLMLRNQQRNQHVDVQKADHGQDYSPAPSARRSTSSTDSVGAPGRRGKTGTPRSNRTSALAIRLSSASTNSSTRCPDWLARSASRSFNAASTVIVAFGITSLSHDVVKSVNRETFPLVALRHDASPLGWSQIWSHLLANAANHSRISTSKAIRRLPWAQGVAGSNPDAPTTSLSSMILASTTPAAN